MKKIFFLFLIVSLFLIAGCGTTENIITGEAVKNISTPSQETNEQQVQQTPDENKQTSINQQETLSSNDSNFTKPVPTPSETKKTCEVDYLDEYQCNGSKLQRKWQYLFCSTEWKDYEYCSYGCENGKCKSAPLPTCADECNQGDTRCNGNYKQICDNYDADDCLEWPSSTIGNGSVLCDYECENGACKTQPPTPLNYRVSNVIDGDTIDLNNGDKVRLIGINSAESGEKCYQEAKDYLINLIQGKEITMESDVTDKDQYNRLLRYVFYQNMNVNIEMVKQGLAHVYIVGSNIKYKSELENAEDIAKANNGCLWEKSTTSCKDCIKITNFHYDAEGNDNYNLNDEYVTFQNTCSYSCDLTGWTIKDDTASHIYTIPSFMVQEETTFTLYTGIGTNTNSALYWRRTNGDYAAIWNNAGDTLYLRDNNGDLVLSYGY